MSSHQPAKQTPRKRVVVPNPNPKPITAAAKHNTATSVTSFTSNPAAAQPPSSSSSTTAPQPPSSSSTTAPQPPSSSTAALQPPSSSSSNVITEWGECSWAVKATRYYQQTSLTYFVRCKMKLVMSDDIYAQMPCQLVMNRRFNLPQDNSYLINSKRHLNRNGNEPLGIHQLPGYCWTK